MRQSYARKWNRFTAFRDSWTGEDTSPLCIVFPFLLQLLDEGLAYSSLRVYLAAISAHHRLVDSHSVFSHPLTKKFLKGLARSYPVLRRPTPSWELPLVLQKLTGKPFEPMATAAIHLVTWKTAFLIAVTSARRVGELRALRVDPPYLTFHEEGATLFPDFSFLPKVPSSFHSSAKLHLPTFYPSPSSDEERRLHCLDVKRVLLFYLDRTKDFRKSQYLFLVHAGPRRGHTVSSQRLAKWIVETIRLAYLLAKRPLPGPVKAHSTRAMAASTAFMKWASLTEVCQAATWSSPHTFVRHYAVDIRARQRLRVGRCVLEAGH